MKGRYAPIEDYGIIGDLHTVALVGKDGSIDFLCLPSFDSPSVFAALLDADRGGRFQIAPQLDDAVHRQLYLPDTNVLLTRFLSDSGVAEVSDFMPVEDAGVAHNLVRCAKTVRGEIRFAMRCEPRFDYARATHTAERRSEKEILFVGRSGHASWRCGFGRRSPWRLRMEPRSPSSRSAPTIRLVRPGSRHRGRTFARASGPIPNRGVQKTVKFWRAWIGRSTYKNRWREMVNRSALDAQASHLQAARLDRGGPHFRAAGKHRRRAELGLSVLVDPRLVIHALRSHAAWLHGARRRTSCAG